MTTGWILIRVAAEDSALQNPCCLLYQLSKRGTRSHHVFNGLIQFDMLADGLCICSFFFYLGECVRCMFWNNLGCIHFAMGKHNLGIFYLKKALQENDHTCAQLGDGTNGQG